MMNRRNFIETGTLLAATALPVNAMTKSIYRSGFIKATGQIDFIFDGAILSPEEYSELLMRLVDEGKIREDNYSIGGVVEELEYKFASLLGKESAVFMPTGTLANQIAVRELARSSRRVIVQEQSHLYNDCGDCSQTLSDLNLIPLGKDQANFSIDEVKEAYSKSRSGRVETNIGVIAVESPVRRKDDLMFGLENIRRISDFARNNGIKMHMDGARLFVETAHTGVNPIDYGQLFDTVYISMYKCFNSLSGAILAGDKKFTEKLFHTRRMFGGGLPHVWPFAAVALYYADGFEESYKKAWANSQRFFDELTRDERFIMSEFQDGTHIVNLEVKHKDLEGFRNSLLIKNIALRSPHSTGFRMKINPTINRGNPKYLAESFIDSLNGLN